MTKIRALLVALAGLALGTALLTGCSSTSGVSGVDAAAWLTAAKQPGAVVVDVRTPGEYAAGHIDGAVNIDVESPDFDGRLAALDKDATYLVYCQSGRRSGIATGRMGDAGFTSVSNLQGGIGDLVAAGGQVVAS